MQTRVVGCRLHTSDLCYVRIENSLLFIAFDSLDDVILYVRQVSSDEEDIQMDRKILKSLLGPLYRESSFGIHQLKGGDFEVVIPNKEKVPSLSICADSKTEFLTLYSRPD